jgi:hypothetical protein
LNYFAHGREFLDNPYFLAGTAVPDWLNVIDRRMRVRSKRAVEFIADEQPTTAAVARGIVQHHRDDDWFHQTRAFVELCLDFAVRIRNVLPADEGFRPSFLGHIRVELLLDAHLIAARPEVLTAYYQALRQVDPQLVQQAVNRMATKETDRFPIFLPRFIDERFLYDYAADDTLLMRLNHVLRRVGLPLLPADFAEILGPMRLSVQQRQRELLGG